MKVNGLEVVSPSVMITGLVVTSELEEGEAGALVATEGGFVNIETLVAVLAPNADCCVSIGTGGANRDCLLLWIVVVRLENIENGRLVLISLDETPAAWVKEDLETDSLETVVTVSGANG